jgi:hypothetical protein
MSPCTSKEEIAMKKIRIALPLLVIITALFAFTGCDAILEVFYPEFATAKGGNISIWAQFEMQPSEISSNNVYIYGQIIDTSTKSGGVVRELETEPVLYYVEEKSGSYWIVEGNLDFLDIEDGNYEVLVWLEQTGDDEPSGQNEPSEYAKRNDTGDTVFSFPGTSASEWLYGEVFVPLN